MNVVDYLFQTSARLDRPAVIAGAEQINYPALYEQVHSLAGWLRNSLGRDQKIILISDNTPFFVTVYLAIMKSGNVCVPLNPAITDSSLGNIIAQCEATTAFVQEKSAERFAGQIATIYGEGDLPGLKAAPLPVEADFDDDQLAELIFTSGSTALPKGVMLSHRNLRANTESIIEYLQLAQEDRMLVVLPFYYCYGLSLLHTHFRVGGSLVLNNTFLMLNTVIRDLQEHRCSGFAGVPSHFQIMLRKSRKFRESQFPDLRYVTQAGGKLPTVFIREFREHFPDIAFYVMYGQTEATARLSYLPPAALPEKIGSIGRGIPGVDLAVLNPDGNPVQPGEVGELAAAGDNIMLGYFHDPQLTAQTIRNGRLYTGDIGTVDEQGYIYVLAREKEFLKVGGERVSPKEIEETIVALPEVVDCSIVGVEDEVMGEAIKAYIVLNSGAELSERDIINYCMKHLSSAKVPKTVEFLDKIPVAATGKKVKANLAELNK
ncbi:MAG: AMP-binding protein [Calditrichaeota bacterium]|nr:AMP-binding protein [Calditrichota bacterium]HQU71926.1 AMP-binding protein [Calditrichia bacterium]